MAETLRFYSNPISQPSRAVTCFLTLNQIPFENHNVDFGTGQQRTPEFRAVNPAGLIPAIIHGSMNLAESGAIMVYLAEAFHVNNQWYPADIQQRANINAYLHWHHGNTRKNAYGFVFPKVVGPLFLGMPQLTAEKEVELRANLATTLTFINGQLEKHNYVAKTSQASMADLQCFCELAQLKLVEFNFDFTPYPALKKWYEEIESIPQVAEAHQAIYGFARSLIPPQA